MRKKNLLYHDVLFYFLMLMLALIWPSIMLTTTAEATTLKNNEIYSLGFKNEPILRVFSKIESISGLVKELSSKSGLKFNISKGLVAVLPQEGFPFDRQ